jgi:putative aldouronate transport system substrate-binding protein
MSITEEAAMKRTLFLGILCLAVLMVACTGGDKAKGGQEADLPGTPKGARTTGPNYWMVKYDNPVTLHVIAGDFGELVYSTPGDDITNNEWIRGLKRDLNIDVVTDWVTPLTEYFSKLNLSIASGKIPDVMLVNENQFKQMAEAGMLADITDYIENNASGTMKAILNSSEDILDTAKRDGRLYAVPVFGYGPMIVPQLLWIRRDWMRAANKPEPNTFADLEELMKTFMRDHPGTYGFPLDRGLGALYSIAQGYNAYPAWIRGKDGTIVNGLTQPEMKEVLALFADWYKKGYIKKDFMSTPGDAVREDIVSGKVGLQIFPQWWGWHAGTDVVKNLGKEAYFEAYDLPSKDGKPVNHLLGFDNEGYLVISKDCENIDAVIKAMSWHLYITLDAVEQGIMTFEEQRIYGGSDILKCSFKLNVPLLESLHVDQVQYAKKTGDTTKFTNAASRSKYEMGHLYDTTGDLSGLGDFLQTYADRCAYLTNIEIIKDNRFIASYPKGMWPDEFMIYGSTLDDILMEGFTKIIIGQEPVSYFDTLVSEWKAAGGNDCIAAMNRDYGNK